MTLRFGISGAYPEQFAAFPARLPEPFCAVEFPGDMLENSSGYQKLAQLARNGIQLYGRDFISPEIAALIPEENCKLRSELENHFQKRCAKSAALGVKEFSVAFDLFQALGNEECREKLGRFLRRCAGVTWEFGQKLRLVCRIPGGGNFDRWDEVMKFRNQLLSPNIELLLELHPHEPAGLETLNKALGYFRLHDDCRRICFDSGIGNTLTHAAIKRCSNSLVKDLEMEMLLFFIIHAPCLFCKSVFAFFALSRHFLPMLFSTLAI